MNVESFNPYPSFKPYITKILYIHNTATPTKLLVVSHAISDIRRVNDEPGTFSPPREDLHKELIKQEISKVKLEKRKGSLEIAKLRHGIII